MLPSSDEFNEVFESLFKGGTRYRTEKIGVLLLYALVVGVTVLWVVTGIEIGGGRTGTLETTGSPALGSRTLVVTNTSGERWRDVRIVVNDKYLAKIAELEPDAQQQLQPSDFANYFHVPRPWGHAVWERVGRAGGRVRVMPTDVGVRNVKARSREGRIVLERKGDSG